MSEIIEKIADFKLTATPYSEIDLGPVILIDELPFARGLILNFTLLNIRPSIMYNLTIYINDKKSSEASIAISEYGVTFNKEINNQNYGNGQSAMKIEFNINDYGVNKITLELKDERNLVIDSMTKFISFEKADQL